MQGALRIPLFFSEERLPSSALLLSDVSLCCLPLPFFVYVGESTSECVRLWLFNNKEDYWSRLNSSTVFCYLYSVFWDKEGR